MTLKDRRKRLGLSLSAVSAESGVARGHLCDIENGRAPLSLRTARRLARVYGLKQWWRLCNEPARGAGKEGR